MSQIKLTECPRDAMQGLHDFAPTDVKAHYINLLLKCGFDTIDFGSFVSPKAIPQMQDTAAVLDKLDMGSTQSKLLAIIANYRGAEEAAQHEAITYLGFPFSISETFQMRNTNSTIDASFDVVKKMQELCVKKNKNLLVYLSMGFGNPYGDIWNTELVLSWAEKLIAEGINDISLADTIGMASPEQIRELYPLLTNAFPGINFGIHLHSTPDSWFEKIDAAYQSNCRHFDTALKGYGGCPMAKDDLTGNIATENVLSYLDEKGIDTGVNMAYFTEAMSYSGRVFG
ncbi:hydroxymethylglutaryl-CoA lyase [Mucilaginibacter boryungensis]|uniref:Hydroxymethylglutaryl-CoA lyase n=1 Tax=Mucilaginibacter boryungensis TaxID=768480 RepID=A0ABR9XHM0_9SPHI|nr:hydroxymethylglutaryl-CoA lyase [Mucilaginibacter boryungensis]MBE9666731.1 hydroxymethylglutaryl-CoA lyase [Mucilaginibacter boryungensis]